MFARLLRQESLRFRAFNDETIPNQFAVLDYIMSTRRSYKDRVFNLDEIGISPARDFIKGTRQRRLLLRQDRSAAPNEEMLKFAQELEVTIMPMVSAAGKYGPTWVVVCKRDTFPFQVVLNEGNKYVETSATFLPRRSVIGHRSKRGSVDTGKFWRG